MPGTGLPKETKRRRKSRESKRKVRARRSRKKVIATWSAVICGVAAAGLGISIWLGLSFKPGESPQPLGVAALPKKPAESAPEKPGVPTLSEDAALTLVRNGLAVRDPGKISQYFRQGETAPADQVDFLRTLESKDGEIDRLEWLGTMDAGGVTIDSVMVEFKSPDRPRNRLAALVADDHGKWKIDFDTFARTVRPSWDQIVAGQAPTAKVRAYVAKDSYFNGPFKDENEWISIGIASPDTEEILTGYCKVGTPQASAMRWIFSKDSQLNRVVLELHRVEGAEPRQLEITRVLAEDWVMTDQPFDERFK